MVHSHSSAQFQSLHGDFEAIPGLGAGSHVLAFASQGFPG